MDEKYIQTVISEDEDEIEIDLMEIVHLLWTNILGILLCLFVGAAGTFAFTKLCITKQYTATTSMYVVGDTDSLVDVSALQIGSQIKGDYQELIKSEDMMQDVLDNLDIKDPYEEFIEKVNVASPSDTHVIKISVEDPDPQMAADIANEIASVAKKRLPEIMKTSAPEIYNKAKAPEKASSPNTLMNTAIGGIAVAFLYCALLVIKFMINDSFVTPEDINRVFGVQPLAVVPQYSTNEKKKRGKQK